MKKGMLGILMFVFVINMMTVKTYADSSSEVNAISIAIDISGSMNKTDSSKMSFELIRMAVDYCDDNDYICITAYNDKIVYSSGMVNIASDKDVKELKKRINELEFKGNTDNGLGILTATKSITDSKIDYDNAYVILISDGATDLTGSNTDRTVKDSDNDIVKSTSIAKENNISIDAIELTKTYTADTSKISVATAATKGTTTVVDGISEYIQVFLSLLFSEYNGAVINWNEAATSKAINRQKISISSNSEKEKFAVIVTTGKMEDFDLIDKKTNPITRKGNNYAIIRADKDTSDMCTALFSLNEDAQVLSGEVIYDRKDIVEEPTVAPTAEPTKKPTKAPTKAPVKVSTQKPDKEDETDDNRLFVILIISGIALVTVLICAVIIKKVLFGKKKDTKRISGYITATFINLKSKNETRDITWNLDNYPAAGVTLLELFHGVDFMESLKDMDKICFYPGANDKELLIVHCMEGGVFVEEDNVKMNKPYVIADGTTIYLTFADNASEIKLFYTASAQEGKVNEY